MKATYVDHMGTDNRVVESARVSFSKLASEYTNEQNEKLISYLARHNHFTPFTHPQITIHEKVPIFVARQRFKHTVGFTYNELSRRYVNEPPEFFDIAEWRKAPEGSIKQGSGGIHESSDRYRSMYTSICQEAEILYKRMIEEGVAPEQARAILPQGLYTEYYVTGSLAAWARAYKLRSSEHAQKEIQELAAQWNSIIEPLFPISWKALIKE